MPKIMNCSLDSNYLKDIAGLLRENSNEHYFYLYTTTILRIENLAEWQMKEGKEIERKRGKGAGIRVGLTCTKGKGGKLGETIIL